ncbi:MAG: ABC transporter ATP-binding protein [uncultured Campylobacterales bacterium]|uniref:ABC transporter ATP-binding protein n=1 Tax=uncultured Campylobacterales bacterium TaxID=352960 RepID=A0A6S6T562_9BACT|nr:MAG: ABC transporter ATP-binding protein [uncultured Campylobacterales bacterium]
MLEVFYIKPLIELKNIDISINNQKILSNISINIQKNESLAIVGPNGAGKSTLIKLICGELYPNIKENSSINIFGKTKWNIWELKTHLGIITNELHFTYKNQVNNTGYEVILSGFFSSIGLHQEISNDMKTKTSKIIEFLNIKNLTNKKIAEMSTGEARKILVARALINDPEVLILDEPTVGLDLVAQKDFLTLIQKLVSNGKTIILITHHLEEIFPEINKTALLKNGTITHLGDTKDIITSKNLSQLYNTNVKVTKTNNTYQALIDNS